MPKLRPDVVRCNSCGGVYRTMLDDGTLYFHACPPDVIVTPPVVDPATHEMTTPAVLGPRPNRRDENVRRRDDDGVVAITSEGLGATRVDDPDVRAQFGL